MRAEHSQWDYTLINRGGYLDYPYADAPLKSLQRLQDTTLVLQQAALFYLAAKVNHCLRSLISRLLRDTALVILPLSLEHSSPQWSMSSSRNPQCSRSLAENPSQSVTLVPGRYTHKRVLCRSPANLNTSYVTQRKSSALLFAPRIG